MSALADINSFILKSRDAGHCTAIIFTDQSSAFNVLDRDILLGKLRILGFLEEALKLIGDYLTCQMTQCTVNGKSSSLLELSRSVCEGSVLGPILYTLGQVCVSIVADSVQELMLTQEATSVATKL